jgi:HEAT repeat protein
MLEDGYLAALDKTGDNEVKAYFMDNLKLVGSTKSVAPLAKYIKHEALFDQAISTLVAISTDAGQQLKEALPGSSAKVQARIVKALGTLKYSPAIPDIIPLASSDDVAARRQALWSLALIGSPSSKDLLLEKAKTAGFKSDPSESVQALAEYMHQAINTGNNPLALSVSKDVLSNTKELSQQHIRLAALECIARVNPEGSVKTLIKELDRFDEEYRKEVLKVARLSANSATALTLWQKAYKKSSGSKQADIFSMLTSTNRREMFVESILVQGLSSENQQLRIAAAMEIATHRDKKFTTPLLAYLLRAKDEAEIDAAKNSLLQVVDQSVGPLVSQRLPEAATLNKIALLDILSQRRVISEFDVVAQQTKSPESSVREAAFTALNNVSDGRNADVLLQMLSATEDESEIAFLQHALIACIDKNATASIDNAYQNNKAKILPLLPYVDDKNALEKTVSTFYDGGEKEREIAFSALENWQDNAAARTLMAIAKDPAKAQYHARAFDAFINQVRQSSWPDDQKLLMLREIMPLAKNNTQKAAVLRAAGNVRTFLSLMFVSEYIDDATVSAAASRSAMQIALPTSDAKPGLDGMEVRKTLERMLDKLTGADSQYERIDILTYLEGLPYTRGYESIFNGKDLTGWQGLVENPIARSKMSPKQLEQKQLEANAKVSENWSIRDGCIYFQGDGANLCTTRHYGDFEMLVDWKISRHGDSGIYLRGSPQVQIWDVARTDVGAQVGSGGLYNNQHEKSTPLVVADNPVGEWNTFYIKMTGDRVTVRLNGVLVVDSVVMENYWDRSIPIFNEEAIELQAHGTELAFRNIYVRELGNKPYQLSSDEKAEGFAVLFDGTDLNQWVGNKTDYVVEDNALAIYPAKESHGNLYTAEEYGNFVFRFEFQLTPGANNGLGIHTPLEGDAAYVGKEIQILDNTAPVYAKLEPWQYHGSVYGILPAKRGYLKPVGEWNQEEVEVKGDYIKITLNGTVILEGDLAKATRNGTVDHKEHPGLQRHRGHIGFLGHGTIVRFRNIRIKKLPN